MNRLAMVVGAVESGGSFVCPNNRNKGRIENSP